MLHSFSEHRLIHLLSGGEVPASESTLRKELQERGEKREKNDKADSARSLESGNPEDVEKRAKEMQDKMEAGLASKRAEVTNANARTGQLEKRVQTESQQSLAARERASKQTDAIMKGVTEFMAPGAPMPEDVQTRPRVVTQAQQPQSGVKTTAADTATAADQQAKKKEAAGKSTVQESGGERTA